MTMIAFRSKEDKEHLLTKAKRMEEYASMIVDCLEKSDYDEETNYRHHYDDEDDYSRYDYRRINRRMR